jgi:hypothetical protein
VAFDDKLGNGVNANGSTSALTLPSAPLLLMASHIESVNAATLSKVQQPNNYRLVKDANDLAMTARN